MRTRIVGSLLQYSTFLNKVVMYLKNGAPEGEIESHVYSFKRGGIRAKRHSFAAAIAESLSRGCPEVTVALVTSPVAWLTVSRSSTLP